MSLNEGVSEQNIQRGRWFPPDIPAPAVEEAVVAGGLGEDVPGDGGLAEAQAAVGAGGQPGPAGAADHVAVGALEDPPRRPHLLQADRTLQQLAHTEMCTITMFNIKSHIMA